MHEVTGKRSTLSRTRPFHHPLHAYAPLYSQPRADTCASSPAFTRPSNLSHVHTVRSTHTSTMCSSRLYVATLVGVAAMASPASAQICDGYDHGATSFGDDPSLASFILLIVMGSLVMCTFDPYTPPRHAMCDTANHPFASTHSTFCFPTNN